jgi:hypothetical protein
MEVVAQRAGLSARGTQVLLDGLVGLGLVDVIDGNYRNSPEAAEFLVEGKPADTGGYVKFTFADMGRWAGLPEAVRTGAPLATDTADVTENPFWERLVLAIAVLAVPSALTAADKLNLVNAGPISILDVGGGSRIYSIIWLGMNPQARSTQIDWKNVNQIALAAAADQHIGERFHTLDGDFHTVDFGTTTHDIAIYSHIAHQETPAANTAVIRKLRNALKPKHGATWRERRCCFGEEEADSSLWRHGSDGEGKFGEDRLKPAAGLSIVSEFVVATARF